MPQSLSIVADHVNPFVAEVYASSKGIIKAPCHDADVSNWLHGHDNEFGVPQWSFQSPNRSPIEPVGCGRTGNLRHESAPAGTGQWFTLLLT